MKINFSKIKLIIESEVLKGTRFRSLYTMALNFCLRDISFVYSFILGSTTQVFAIVIVHDKDSSFPLVICSYILEPHITYRKIWGSCTLARRPLSGCTNPFPCPIGSLFSASVAFGEARYYLFSCKIFEFKKYVFSFTVRFIVLPG